MHIILQRQTMKSVCCSIRVLFKPSITWNTEALVNDISGNMENARAFTRFFFQARVMRSVANCDPSTTILGFKSAIPIFVSGAALAKLGHPDGEYRILTLLLECSRTSGSRRIKHYKRRL